MSFLESKVSRGPVTSARDTWLVLLLLALASCLVWPQLFHGWIPWDDGGMALIAERVLHGDLPHRDFDDPWTGGWSYFQAAVFRCFGTSLAMLRVPIFIAWLAGLAGVFRVARRFLDPVSATLLGLACAVWSLAAWHLPLPNWYYAPLAVAAMWAIIRFEEHPHRGWLVVAGACIGFSLAVKVTGLFLFAGVAVWCVARATDAPSDECSVRGAGGAAVAAAPMAVFLAAVGMLLRALPPEFFGAASVHFLLPCVCLAAWVVLRAWRAGRSGRAASIDLARLLLPLVAGIALALVPFVWRFWRADALHDLLVGVFVRPSVRLAFVTGGPPGRVFTALGGLPVAVLFFGGALATVGPPERSRTAWLAAALGASWGAISLWHDDVIREGLVLSVRAVPIMLPMFAFWSDRRQPIDGTRGRMLVLLVAVATTAQLLQVPFAFLSYFLFAAMLSLLAAGSLLSLAVPAHRPLLAFWCCFLLVAGGLPSDARGDARVPLHRLPLGRAGIEVSYLDSVRWGRLEALMRQRPAGAILVVGNAPEVPFLLDRSNVNRAVYDVLSDSSARDQRSVLELAEASGVRTVIIGHRTKSWASRSLSAVPALRRAFPENRWIGPYEVRWHATDTATGALPPSGRTP